MKKAIFISIIIIIGAIALSVYDSNGTQLNEVYDSVGNSLDTAYDSEGNIIFTRDSSDIPVPSGDLTASQVILLPDLYEEGKGFTCTGLAYDGEFYYIGDIGALSGSNYDSQIVVTSDFVTVEKTISLVEAFPAFSIVQGVCVDTSNDSLWACDPNTGKVYNLTKDGAAIGSLTATRPTGIAYQASDDSFWILTYTNKIIHMSKTGTTLAQYDFAYDETLDQCFLDEGRDLLYITAGTNYSGRNNVYYFNTDTHAQGIACTVDSYSVEGIWLGDNDKMIIVNDGYYHSAAVPYNQANIYTIE